MKILAIETSCEHASVALDLDGALFGRALEGHANHSERLLATLSALLAEADVPLAALDAIAFGAGPGAFTGVRLACGVAQGLAMGAGLGVAPVSSLAALAAQVCGARTLAVTDARMGEIYAAAFDASAGLPIALGEPVCCAPADLADPGAGDWVLVGSGLAAHPLPLRERFAGRIAAWSEAAHPRAAEVARIAADMARRGALIAPELASPLYVRNKVALTTAERRANAERLSGGGQR